jgi:hypothetical protein
VQLYTKSIERGMTDMSKKKHKQAVKVEAAVEEPNKLYSFLVGGLIVIAIMVLFALIFH